MVDLRFYSIYLAFLSALEAELKEKYPALSEEERRIYFDMALKKYFLDNSN